MIITLDGITLPAELQWANKYSEGIVAQTTSRSITGALMVQVATKIKGRKITLKGGADYGWVTKTTADALLAKANTQGLQMPLVYRGQTIQVIFDHETGALQIDDAFPYVDDDGENWVRVDSLNFLTV